MTSNNALSSQIVSELIGHELPTFIVLKRLDLTFKVVLSISLEQLERMKSPTLALRVESHFEASVIINKGNTMLITLSGEHLVFIQIRVYEIKGSLSTMTSGRK
jgi:hypothetical protein